jgi:hypothetical protein
MPVHGGFVSFSSGSVFINPSDDATLTAGVALRTGPGVAGFLPRSGEQPIPPNSGFTIAGLDWIVTEGQSLVAGQDGDPDEDIIIALTTWLELSASNLS